MRTLILMRHAKSDWSRAQLSDHDRPLNARGRRAAPMMAKLLTEHGLRTDVILASTAERVRETLEHVQASWAKDAEVLTRRELYLATPDVLAECIHSLNDSWEHVMLVGHNPGISELASQLSAQRMDMPTASIAVFQTKCSSWKHAIRACDWELYAFWKPRDQTDADK